MAIRTRLVWMIGERSNVPSRTIIVNMATLIPGPLPPRFADLKREIAQSGGPDFEQRITAAWAELLAELAKNNAEIEKAGSQVLIL